MCYTGHLNNQGVQVMSVKTRTLYDELVEGIEAMKEQREDIVYKLRLRAEIRSKITTRKSVLENKPDRIAALLLEAADEIESLRNKLEELL